MLQFDDVFRLTNSNVIIPIHPDNNNFAATNRLHVFVILTLKSIAFQRLEWMGV